MNEQKNFPGNTPMLVMKLLEGKEMYGWEIIEVLAERSFNAIHLKSGAIYPILHDLENKGYIVSDKKIIENGRARKYYKITDRGKEQLNKKITEWDAYMRAVENVIKGGVEFATT